MFGYFLIYVLFINVILAVILLLFGAGIFIKKLFSLNFKDIKRIIISPTFLLIIMVLLFIIFKPSLKYYPEEIKYIFYFFIGVTSISISRIMTLNFINLKNFKILWITPIFFGFESLGIYIILINLSFKELKSIPNELFDLLIFHSGFPIVPLFLFLFSMIINIISSVFKYNKLINSKISKKNDKN